MAAPMSEAEFFLEAARPLACYWGVLALGNAGAAWREVRRAGRGGGAGRAGAWAAFALLFAVLAVLAAADPRWLAWLGLPPALRRALNAAVDPRWFLAEATAALVGAFLLRRWLVRPPLAWTALNLVLLWLGLSLTDPDFARIVVKPDNVAVVGMLLLVAYFTWLGAWRAVENDARRRRGLGPREAEESDAVLVWPDLVYIELICMVAVTAVLLAWSLLIRAPLEAPANPAATPNPSKAPWYFVGLQEMLGYFDPWLAGVVFPTLILIGLMALPYLDPNPSGNGYYTIAERPLAYLAFQYGWLVLWLMLIVVGVFLRGPNWSFFGPYETWDPHKVETLTNVDLSEYVWVEWLGRPRPRAPEGAGPAAALAFALGREWFGLAGAAVWWLALPALAARWAPPVRRLRAQLGRGRYWLFSFLLLTMLLLPLKMTCRWLFHLQYFIALPEIRLNV